MRSDILIKSTSEKFHLSKSFVQELLTKNGFSDDLYALDYDSFFNTLTPLQQLYIGFSLSTYNRGKEVYDLISPYFDNYTTKRYLDVGCGYGGFLKVFNERGFDSTGVEINDMLYQYSILNCDGLDNCRVINSDFFKLADSHEPYSVITCNDVIEHVENPLEAINKMSDMLQPNGVLMMEIPNKNAINFVASDGHFHMFGITPLNRFEAAEYYKQYNSLTSTDKYYEIMGEYYSLDYYTNILKDKNMNVELTDKHTIGTIDSLPAHLTQLTTSYNTWRTNHAAKLSHMMRDLIELRFSNYMATLMRDYNDYIQTRDFSKFYRKYFLSFWSIIAVKK